MGLRFSHVLAAPLLLATPAFAQQDNSAEPVFNLPRAQPQTSPNQQGPELDVFRGAPTTVTPPPPVAPTVQPPPPVTPATPPAPEQPKRSPPTSAPPVQPAPRAEQPAIPEQAPSTQPETAPATPLVVANETPPPTGNVVAPPPATPQAPVAEAGSGWRWVAAAAALAALVAAFFWLRRRRPAELEEPVFKEEPAPSLTPVPPPAEPRPAPVPSPAEPEIAPPSADRPWLDLAMEVQAARLTLMGATIAYKLAVHNRGSRAAEDILVRGLIANAGAQQQALLQQFFAGDSGLPIHSAVSIAPGETHALTGEMRLNAQEITAIPVGQRALLIPLVAFDAQYRWTDEAGETQGTGRAGQAFIVGQEQSPPVERLAPFRLDLGPRQYRAPGSRATALRPES